MATDRMNSDTACMGSETCVLLDGHGGRHLDFADLDEDVCREDAHCFLRHGHPFACFDGCEADFDEHVEICLQAVTHTHEEILKEFGERLAEIPMLLAQARHSAHLAALVRIANLDLSIDAITRPGPGDALALRGEG